MDRLSDDILPDAITAASQEPRFVIDLADPLLPIFAVQHDLRERFLVAILGALDYLDPDSENFDPAEARWILDKAVDSDEIIAWNDEGRPLPSLDVPLADAIADLNFQVLKAMSKGDKE